MIYWLLFLSKSNPKQALFAEQASLHIGSVLADASLTPLKASVFSSFIYVTAQALINKEQIQMVFLRRKCVYKYFFYFEY